MNKKAQKSVVTPCIGVCSTALGDAVCRGCKRYAHEVIRWNGYSQQEKQAIDQRLDTLLLAVLEGKLKVLDTDLLERRLQQQQIRYPAHKPPLIWVFYLLRAGAGQITDCTEFGFEIASEFRASGEEGESSLSAIKSLLDNEYYALSEAHYERFFAPGLQSTAIS